MSNVGIALHKILTEATGEEDFFSSFDSSYERRVTAQKIIYLLTSRFGAKFPWKFSWYIAGPYSPSLAREFYAIAEELESVKEAARQVEFRPEMKERISRVRSLMNYDYSKTGLTLAEWLELLASVDYISNWRSIDLCSREELVRWVKRSKPKFSEEQIIEAIKCLVERG
jgi:uncharacterized protein YwgA